MFRFLVTLALVGVGEKEFGDTIAVWLFISVGDPVQWVSDSWADSVCACWAVLVLLHTI